MENHYFDRRYIFKGSIFHCYVGLQECILSRISSHVWQPQQNSFGHLSSHIVPSSYGLRDPVSLKCSFLTAEFLSSTKDSTKQITWEVKQTLPVLFKCPLQIAPSYLLPDLSAWRHGGDPCLPFPMGEISGLAHQVLTHGPTSTSGPIAASPLAPAVPQGAARPDMSSHVLLGGSSHLVSR